MSSVQSAAVYQDSPSNAIGNVRLDETRRRRRLGVFADIIAGFGLLAFPLDAVYRVHAAAAGEDLLLELGLLLLYGFALLGAILEAAATLYSASPFQRGRHLLALVLLIALTGLFCSSKFYAIPLRNYGIRWRVQSICGEARLQAWAANLLKQPASQWPTSRTREFVYPPPVDNEISLDEQKLPKYVTDLSLPSVARSGPGIPFSIIPATKTHEAYVRITIHSVSGHRTGVIVGNNMLRLKSRPGLMVFPLRDGLYRWSTPIPSDFDQLRNVIGDAELQKWAIDMLHMPISDLPLQDERMHDDPAAKYQILDGTRLPQQVRDVHIGRILKKRRDFMIVREDDGTRYIQIVMYEARFAHRYIIVGDRNFKWKENHELSKWRNGLYATY